MIRVAIISFPWRSHVPYKFLSDILKILDPTVDKIVLIDGNICRIKVTSEKVETHDIGIGMHYLKDIRPTILSAILWFIKCISVQLIISLELIKERRNIDVVLFYTAYPYYLLPLITSKIINKKTIEIVTRGRWRTNFFFSKILSLQDATFYRLLDGISPESISLIKELGLEKYYDKLLPHGARFIEASRYTIKKKLSERKNIVGYIGRLRKEKGVVEFVEAIYLLQQEDIEFLIGGDGDLSDFICRKKTEKGLRIMMTDFIKSENIPDILNELKILVLPTYSEGLPTIILEAMACGTIVLATSVGAISDLIIDEDTGFILEDNSPKCIAKNIIRILNHTDIERIVNNARMLIEKEYTYDTVVNRYREIIYRTIQKKSDYKCCNKCTV